MPHDSGSAKRGGLSRESGLERGDRRSFRRDLLCACLGRGLDLGRQRGLLLCEQAIPLGLAGYTGIGRLVRQLSYADRYSENAPFAASAAAALSSLAFLPFLLRYSVPSQRPRHTWASGGVTHAPFDHSWASRASASAAAFAFLPSAASSLRACVRGARCGQTIRRTGRLSW